MSQQLLELAAFTAGQDPAVISAWLVGLAGLVGAAAGLVKVVVSRPRLPVAEEVMERLHELEDVVLQMSRWIANTRAAAAMQGFDLPALPLDLTMLGHPSAQPPKPEKETPTP